MITEILARPELKSEPPVLLDIGAAAGLQPLWKDIAPHSICIAFEGDEREFGYIEEKRKQFKKLIIVNNIVSATGGKIDFHLTHSPQCSSTLQTETENLSNYAFADLFQINKTIQLSSVQLSAVLEENKISYIDWFKTDTQGTDLRLIQSLNESFINNVIVYELEPGIIDAYVGEDKLYHVLEFFNKKKFIVLEAIIKGSCRVNKDLLKNKLPVALLNKVNNILPATPDWCEAVFFNPFTTNTFTIRQYLLGWIFATLKQQHGLAFEIAEKGFQNFNDVIFKKMSANTIDTIKTNFEKRPAKRTIKRKLIKLLEKL